MTVPPKFRGRLSGLCGNFNGDENDDFQGKDKQTYHDVQHFGNSWRVGGFRACSILPQDMNHSYEPKCKQSWTARIQSDRFCNALKSSLFEKCAGKVDPQYYFEACKFDMCECPGDQCHCEVLTAYARECELAGHFIENWRDSTGCRNVTSFKYGAHLKSKNEVFPIVTTTTGTTTVTTTTTTTTTTTAIPAWILSPKSSKLGPIAPACSHKTARFCRPNKSRRRSSQAERRRRQRRRKRKRNQRKWRRQQRKLRRKQRKQQRKDKSRIFQIGNVAMTMDGEKNQKRRLSWSSLGGKRPPFEALLSTNSRPFEVQEQDRSTKQEDWMMDFDPSFYQDRISSSDLSKPRNGRKRTPLPLKESTEKWERRKRK